MPTTSRLPLPATCAPLISFRWSAARLRSNPAHDSAARQSLVSADERLPRRLVGFHAKHVGKDAAFFGAEGVLVAAGVEHHLPLIRRNFAQVPEGVSHHRLAIRW